MTFQEAVSVCLRRKYATFRGRATRSEYWWFWLFCMLALLVATLADLLLFGFPQVLCYWLATLALFLPSTAVLCRRLHDAGFRGWWMLLLLTGIGALVLIVLVCLPSRAAGDRFNEPGDTATAQTAPGNPPDPADPMDPVDRWKLYQTRR